MQNKNIVRTFMIKIIVLKFISNKNNIKVLIKFIGFNFEFFKKIKTFHTINSIIFKAANAP